MQVPSGALAGAAVSAVALADLVAGLTATLPIPAVIATSALTTTRRVSRVLAPRIIVSSDIGAIGAALVGAVQAVARAAAAQDASAALYDLAMRSGATAPRSASPVLTRQYGLARALAAAVETAALGEAFLAEARTDFADRRAATEARDRISAALDGATDRIAAALGQEVLAVLSRAARETSGHLVRLSTDLQPLAKVETTRSYPSTALAWGLYADPARADEIVRRNRVGTPLFMPTSIEAVAPKV